MKTIFYFFFVTYSYPLATSVKDEKIEADRPSETQTPSLATKGQLQAEFGFRKDQQREKDYAVVHPRSQLHYGLSRQFELRSELTVETHRQYSTNEFHYSLQPVQLGFKAKLTEQKAALPATSLYTQIGIPNWASKDHQKSTLTPDLRLLFENKLSEKVSLIYNAGVHWQGEESKPQWLYTISPEVELGKHWEAFVETFAYLQSGHAAQHSLDGGVVFFASPTIKLDLWGGKGLSKEAHEYFISTGISIRLKP